MSTVKMENQVDFRTLRTNKDPRQSQRLRDRRQARKAAGLCTICGEEAVLNKANCKACTERHTIYVERRIFRKYNIPLPDELLLPHERILQPLFPF